MTVHKVVTSNQRFKVLKQRQKQETAYGSRVGHLEDCLSEKEDTVHPKEDC